MPEWVEKVTGFINSFTKFLDSKDNAQLIGYLEGGGGFLSLGAGIAKMIIDYKESLKTEYEKSIIDLFIFLFPFTFDQIRTIIQLHGLNEKNLEFDEKELKNQLKRYFSVYKSGLVSPDKIESPWLPMHPLIQKFKNKTIEYLESVDLGSQKIKLIGEFEKSFEYKIANRLYDESNSKLDEFRKIAKEDLVQDKITAYLDFLMRDYHKFNQLYEKDQSSISNLSTVYVHDRKAIPLNIKKSWTETDVDIFIKHSDEIKNVEEILDKFLIKSKNFLNNERLIIGAPYGVGKTTLVRKLVYDCAIKRGKSAKEYIPIIIYLKNGYYFQSESSRIFVETLLKEIFVDFNLERKEDTPVLLILDALDEYSGSSPSVEELFRDLPYFQNFSNKKIIYTTRLNKEFEILSQFENKYVRLLPFNKQQVNNFLQQKRSELTYNTLKDYYLTDEIITKPLILSILVESFPKLEEDFKRINNNNKLTPDLIKTLLYIQMFYEHYYGKYRKFSESDYENRINLSFKDEKKILRLVAYYKQIKKDLNIKELESWSDQTDIKIENLKPILNTYLILTKQDTKNNRQINFLHQTYSEFLLAEYLIEQYVKGNNFGLNSGNPSDVTISFFKGFLDLLNSDDITIDKFVIGNENNKNTLLFSLDYKIQSQQNLLIEVKEKMINTAKESFNNDLINILNIDDKTVNNQPEIPSKLKWFTSYESEVNNYENLWTHRWISLITLGYLANKEILNKLDKVKLSVLINNSSIVPSYFKYLHYIDFSGISLSKPDFSGIIFQNTNFSSARLDKPDFSRAQMTNTDFSRAQMNDTDFSRAEMTNTKLADTKMIDSKKFFL